MSATCSSVTLPSGSNFSSSSCVSRCCASAPGGRPAITAAVAAPTCRSSRREIISGPLLVPDARHAGLEPLVLRPQIELEIAILLGVGRQFVGADIDLTPLEALTKIPDRLQAGAAGREMNDLPARLAEPLAADPLISGNAVAIGTGKVELAELALGQVLAALERGLGRLALGVDLDRLAIRQMLQIDRHRLVVVGLHQPVGPGCRLGVARHEFLDTEHLAEPRLPPRHAGRPGLELRLRCVVAGV